MKHSKKIALTGVLAAMSAILYMFPTFYIFPMFKWLEIDFSDVPALFAAIVISPLVGLAVVAIKVIVHLPFSSTMWTGELSNFLISGVFVLVMGLIFHKQSDQKERTIISTCVVSSMFQIVTAAIVNYFIMVPFYSMAMNFDFATIGGKEFYIYAGVLPFNAIKDVVTCIVFCLVYKYVRPHLSKILR